MLKDKIIIVTGGSGLIGKAIISEIRKKNGVAINVDIDIETNIEQNNIKCDITNISGITQCVEMVKNHYGRIDGLVNNAYPRKKEWASDFIDIKPENLSQALNWQLNSYILCCQQFIKEMLTQEQGAIINISSIYGVVGNDPTIYEGTPMNPSGVYCAVKGGLVNITRFLAAKYGKDNIRINCVSPGGIFDHQDPKFVKAYENRVPMKRMGTPEDIAPSVAFLLSDDAKYITGQNLIVDGGWTAI